RREWNVPGTVVLVEGENDRRSLSALGVSAPIRIVHNGESLAGLAGSISSGVRRVVVLTDWDAAGGRIARRMRELLADGRLEVDLDSRRRLSLALRAELVHVEGLHSWVERKLRLSGDSLDEWLARTA
ncbi:MAG TPA: hypothetical protein VGU43_05275, partial [Thermoplasmata archaeon]|nr:hypothetical protein [Thermoplasmata archaeon]